MIYEDNVDKYDYFMGAFIGLFSGILDVIYVGAPGDSLLSSWTDNKTNDLVMLYAKWKGYKPQDGTPDLQNAIQFLERHYKVNYDHATSKATGDAVNNLLLDNHHIKSLAHSPDLIGLAFAILDQFQGKSSFIDNGKLIRIDSDFNLEGSNFISKVYAGAGNWFGHLMSDIAGSGTSAGKGNRGSGIPIPFYNMFLACDFGSFGKENQTLADTMVDVFRNGYDMRFAFTMAIPVIVGDLITRLSWCLKRRFYHKWDWRSCRPSDDYKSYRRMQLSNSFAFCMVDGVDAYIRGKGNPVEIILRMNLIAWMRLVKLIIKEIMKMYGRSYEDIAKDLDKINAEITKELELLKSIDYAAWQEENERVKDLNRRLELSSDYEIGQIACEYCFANQVKLNYSNVNEFKSLLKAKKPLW